jgi:hypothetical protein
MQLNTVMQYADSHDDLIQEIADLGHEISLIIQGPMGWGKSAMLRTLGAMDRFKGYTLIYIDCTTKSDSGDFFMIKYGEDGTTFLTVPHEELGLHLEGPVIIMFDEIGKMPRSAFNAVLRILYERKSGTMSLHPDSVVFATTNLAAEGLGDLLPPHGINRCQVRTMKVPTKMGWLSWAIRNSIHDFIMSYANQNDHIFTCFLEHEEIGKYPELYDPRAVNKPVAYVTGRSMENASHVFHAYDRRIEAAMAEGTYQQGGDLEKKYQRVLLNGLVGTVGPVAANHMMTYFKMQGEIPTRDQIIQNPMSAPIPKSGAAKCLLISRTLSDMDREFAAPWMTYLMRKDFTPVDQALFGMGTRVKGYPKLRAVSGNTQYQKWAEANSHLFG